MGQVENKYELYQNIAESDVFQVIIQDLGKKLC